MTGPANDHDLTSALHQRADDFARLGGQDLDLAQVVSRAGEIRRGRRMRASMVMAAVVLAVAVPVGVLALGNDPDRVHPAPSPTGTADASPTPEPNTDPITLDGLTLGAAPRTAYWADGKLRFGSTEVTLERRPVYLAHINGGFLYTEDLGYGEQRAHFVSDDGTVLAKDWSVVGGFAVSPEGNVGAFADFNGKVWAVQDGGARYFEVGQLRSASQEDSFSAVAVTGENCSGRSEEIGCTVYAEDNGVARLVAKISPHQESQLVHPALKSLVGVNPKGLVAGFTSVSNTGSCSAVLDNADDQVWRDCDHSFDSFSPGGEYLLGGPAYRDGPGDVSLAVLDPSRDGDPKSTVLDLPTGNGALVIDKAWEDANHFLALVQQGNVWAVVRFGLDGNRELALPVVQGVLEEDPPYALG